MRPEQHGCRLDIRETYRPGTERSAHRQSHARERQDAFLHLRTTLRGSSRLPAAVEHTQRHTPATGTSQTRRRLPPEAGQAARQSRRAGAAHQQQPFRRGKGDSIHAHRVGKPAAGRHEVRHTLHRRGGAGSRGGVLDSHTQGVACGARRRPLPASAHRQEHSRAERRTGHDAHGAHRGEQAGGGDAAHCAIPHERGHNAVLQRMVLSGTDKLRTADKKPWNTRLRLPHDVDRHLRARGERGVCGRELRQDKPRRG